MAAGNVAAQMIVQITVQLQQALSDLRKVQGEFDKTADSAQGMYKRLKSDLRATGTSYELFGKKSEGVSERMKMLEGSVTSMLKNGISPMDSKIRAQVKVHSLLGDQLKNSSVQAKGFQEALKNVAQKGFAQLDMMSGGTVSAIGDVGKSLGVTAKGAGAIGIAIAAVVISWKTAIQPGIQFNMMLEQQAMAFEVMLGSAKNAKAMMDELKTLAVTTPIGLEEGASGTKQLLAYGFAQDEIIKNLKMISTVAKAVNVPLQDVVYVYGTLRAQGRAYTRDLMQFAMRGIPIYEYLAQVMKVSTKEIKDLTEAGKIGFSEVKQALTAMTSEGGKFAGLLEKSMGTAAGKVTLLQNAWKQLTGTISQASMPFIKVMLDSLIRIVKNAEGFRFILSGVATLLTSIGALLTLVLELVNGILSGIVKVSNMIAEGVDGLSKWVESLTKAKPSFSAAVIASEILKKNMKEAANQAERAYAALRKTDPNRKETGVDYGIPMRDARISDPFLPYTEGVIKFKKEYEDMAKIVEMAQFSQKTGKVQKNVEEIIKWANEASLSQEKYYVQLALQADAAAKNMGVSWKYAAQRIAMSLRLSQDATDAFLARGGEFERFFDKYKELVDSSFSETPTTIRDALEAAGQVLDKDMGRLEKKSQFAFIDTAYAKDIEGALEQKVKWLEAYIGNIQSTVDTLSLDKAFQGGEGNTNGIKFLQALIEEIVKARKELAGLQGGTIEKEGAALQKSMDMELPNFSEYMKYRADTFQKENDLILSGLVERGLAELNYGSQVQRQIEEINYSYDKQRTTLMDNDKILYQDKNLLIQMLNAMQGMDTAAVEYNAELKIAQDALKTYGGFTSQLMWQNRLYYLQKTEIMEIGDETKRRLQLDALEMQHAEALLAIKEREYDLMVKGNSEYFRRIKAGAVDAAKSGNYAGAAASMAKGATEGTEIGSLLSGADPIMMVISSLLDFAMSIENVQKLLNPLSTALDGLRAVVEGPINDALQPVVNVLEKLGEIVGVFLLPFIEYVGWALNTLGDTLMPILEAVKVLVKVLAPLVLLFIKILNPMFFLVDAVLALLSAFNQLNNLSQSNVDMEAQRQRDLADLYDKQLKSLQDLYNVGAISGKEYETRLAAMKKNQPGATTQAKADPVQVLLTSIDVAMKSVEKWLKDSMALVFNPLKTALDTGLGRVKDAFAPLATAFSNAISGIGNSITASLTGMNTSLSTAFTTGFNTMFRGFDTFSDDSNALLSGAIDGQSEATIQLVNGIRQFYTNIEEMNAEVSRVFSQGIADFVNRMSPKFAEMGANVGAVWERVSASLLGSFNSIIDSFTGALDPIFTTIESIVSALFSIAMPIVEMLTGILASAITIGASVLAGIVDLVASLAEIIAPIIEVVGAAIEAAVALLDYIFRPWVAAIGVVVDAIGPIVEDIFGIASDVFEAVGEILEVFTDLGVTIFNAFASIFGLDLIQSMGDFFGSGLVENIRVSMDIIIQAIRIIRDAINFVLGFIKVFTNMIGLIFSVLTGNKEGIATYQKQMSEAALKVWQSLEGIFIKVWDILRGLGVYIGNIFIKGINLLGTIIQKLVRGFGTAFGIKDLKTYTVTALEELVAPTGKIDPVKVTMPQLLAASEQLSIAATALEKAARTTTSTEAYRLDLYNQKKQAYEDAAAIAASNSTKATRWAKETARRSMVAAETSYNAGVVAQDLADLRLRAFNYGKDQGFITSGMDAASIEQMIAMIIKWREDGTAQFAKGAGYIPKDMMAQLHQGEGVIPRDFMESIRTGDLALTGKNSQPNSGGVNVYVTVEGSVTTERDLAIKIAKAIPTLARRGYVG